eukprot:871633_1
MGNSTSSHQVEIPTVKYIFKYGPQFDHDARMKLDTNKIIFPFENESKWTQIVEILSNEANKSDEFEDKISNLQNIFKSLSNHNGYKFIQHLKTYISLKAKKK